MIIGELPLKEYCVPLKEYLHGLINNLAICCTYCCLLSCFLFDLVSQLFLLFVSVVECHCILVP